MVWLASAAVLLGTAGCARTSAGSGGFQPSGPSVPRVQALRIAAQCSGRLTYVPSWLPTGFRLTSWTARGYHVFCDEGPLLRFRGGSNELTWVSTWANPRWMKEPGCAAYGSVVGHLRGHAVRRRVAGTVEQVWTCLKVEGSGFQLDLVASQKAGTGAASSAELARIVSSARPLPPGRAADGRFELIPAAEAKRLSKAFGSPLFFPKTLPSGFIFSQAGIKHRDPDMHGRDSLFVDFGRDGPVLEWGVYAGRDKYAIECPAKRAAFAKTPFLVIHGIDIFLIVGNHGGSAWRCIPAHAIGNAKPLQVELWYDARVDSPAMRRQASEIVANARLVKGR